MIQMPTTMFKDVTIWGSISGSILGFDTIDIKHADLVYLVMAKQQ